MVNLYINIREKYSQILFLVVDNYREAVSSRIILIVVFIKIQYN